MAVCELPPLCSKSTPLKKKKNSHHCCMSEAPPLKKATPVARQKYPLCSKSTPSQKKSPLLHVESTPSARKAPPLKKKAPPLKKREVILAVSTSHKIQGNLPFRVFFTVFHVQQNLGKRIPISSNNYHFGPLVKNLLLLLLLFLTRNQIGMALINKQKKNNFSRGYLQNCMLNLPIRLQQPR